jgi:2-methylcitrate dehydratase PrpD
VPGIRSVEYPSMNKDGVPFGVMIGMLAVQETLCGFTGNKNLLEADEYRHALDDLGRNWEVMNLYFKPYPCCRWAHPAIDACLSLTREHAIRPEEIAKVTVDTFYKATQLSKIVPKDADEAQYNIAYPVAAALVYGDFGLAQLRDDRLGEKRVVDMMDKLEFRTEPEFDAQFPAHRICRATIETKDGKTFVSDAFEPRGEACEHVGLDWLCDKFRRVTGSVFSKEGQDALLGLITGEKNVPVREIVGTVNRKSYW